MGFELFGVEFNGLAIISRALEGFLNGFGFASGVATVYLAVLVTHKLTKWKSNKTNTVYVELNRKEGND